MSATQIESWLNRDDDYSIGLSFYLRLGKSDFLKNMLAKGESVYNRQRLRKELFAIVESLQQKKDPEKPKNVITDDEYTRLPKEGKELQAQWKAWYSEMNALRHQLMNPVTEKVRHESAVRILALDQKVRNVWKQLDYWRAYGELPKSVEGLESLKSLPVIDLVKRKNNLATYISKFNKVEQKASQVVAWKSEALQIQQILDGII